MPISPVWPILMDCLRLCTDCAVTVNISRALASAPPTASCDPLSAAFYTDTKKNAGTNEEKNADTNEKKYTDTNEEKNARIWHRQVRRKTRTDGFKSIGS